MLRLSKTAAQRAAGEDVPVICRRRTLGHRLVGLVMAAVVLALGVGVCATDQYEVFSIRNDTDQLIDVVIRYENGDVPVWTDLAPGSEIGHSRMGRCDDGIAIAFDQDGVELARSGPPICRPGRWVVTDSAPS